MESPRIRPEQAEVFAQQARADFKRRATEHVRKHFPDQTAPLSDKVIADRVQRCIERGKEYDFTTQKQIICFLDVTFLLGERFETDPRHADILSVMRTKKMDPTDKAGFVLGLAFGKVEADGQRQPRK